MADYRLSQTQRNQIAEAAISLGLAPADFRWSEEKGGLYKTNAIHKVAHLPTDAHLTINRYESPNGSLIYDLQYWPLTVKLSAPIQTWTFLLDQIRLWLEAVKLEADAPDLWAVANERRHWITSNNDDNSRFTPEEVTQIAATLRTLEEFTVKTFELTAAHHAHVRDRLDYLAEAAGRVGRYDWKNLVTSKFADIIVTLGLEPEKIDKLIGLATRLLGPFVREVGRLLS